MVKFYATAAMDERVSINAGINPNSLVSVSAALNV